MWSRMERSSIGRHDDLLHKGQRYAAFYQLRSTDQKDEPPAGGLLAVAG